LKVKCICRTCGKEFLVFPSQIKVGVGRHCSRSCASYARGRNRIKCICNQCGKEFFAVPSLIKSGGGKYCSRNCYNKSKEKKVKRFCLTCGNEFFAKPCEIKNGKGKYCSRECYGKSRGDVIKRLCKICGTEFKVGSHEIKRGWGKYCSKECANKAKSGKNNRLWKGGKSERRCQACGEVFYVRDSSKSKYCSRECGHRASNKSLKRICPICEKEFEIKPSRLKYGYGKYCSRECYGKSKRVDKVECICKTCGDTFYKYPSVVKNNVGGDMYCSVECYDKSRFGEGNPRWNGGTSFLPYCPKFNERRRKATRDFFNNLCICCGKHVSENIVGGKVVALSVHHSDHDKEQGCNGKPFNLVPLCHDCHTDEMWNQEEYHKYINKTLEEGFKWGIWNEEEYISKVMYPED